MNPVRHTNPLCVALSMLLVVGVVFAPGAAHADDDGERSREYFEQGAEFFFEGRYGRALVEFRRAYRLNPHPMIRYNKALTHFRLENYEDARDHGQALMESGELPDDESVRNAGRTQALSVMLSTRTVGDDIADARDEEQRRHAEREQRHIEAADEASRLGRHVGHRADRMTARLHDADEALASIDEADSDMGALGWTGVGMTGAGAAALTYALVLQLQLNDRIEAYETAADDGDRDQFDTLRTEIETKTRNGQIALYSGAGLAALGTTLWLVGRSSSSSESALSLRPSVGRSASTTTLLKLHGRF